MPSLLPTLLQFYRKVVVFILSIVFVSGTVAGAAEPSPISNVVEFTVANVDPNRHVAPNDKFRVQLRPSWAPLGVERFQELTASNFWQDVRVFRNVDGFMSQFGISSDPRVQDAWSQRGPIRDDAVAASNTRGKLSFATSGENSRTTQLFINTADNRFLDEQGFSPIGEVLPAGDGYGGMEVVDSFFSGYGEQPNQGKITEKGIEYLNAEFPNLSYFEKAVFVFDNGDAKEEKDAASSNAVVFDNEEVKEEKDAASSNAVVLDGDLDVKEEKDASSSNAGVLDGDLGDEREDAAEGPANGSCNNGLGFMHVLLPVVMLSSLRGLF